MMLLVVAVIALGIFALPSTVSLFSGQHTWYDLTGNKSVPCEKCHADIAEEMNALAGPHTGETGFQRMKCSFCHRTFPIESEDINQTYKNYEYTYGSVGDTVTDVTPGKESHAASTVPCMYCHSGKKYGRKGTHNINANCMQCHHVHGGRFTSDDCRRCHAYTGDIYNVSYIPPAGGFGLTANTSSDTGELAAHKTFVMNSISNPQMEDANEACIACHTHIPVKINWTHRYSLEFNATPELELPPTHFNVTDWSINGTYNATVYGNGSGVGSTSGWQ